MWVYNLGCLPASKLGDDFYADRRNIRMSCMFYDYDGDYDDDDDDDVVLCLVCRLQSSVW